MTDINYKADWTDESTSCKNCKMFQCKDGKNACVPPGKTFEEAIASYGEISPSGHCDYFTA